MALTLWKEATSGGYGNGPYYCRFFEQEESLSSTKVQIDEQGGWPVYLTAAPIEGAVRLKNGWYYVERWELLFKPLRGNYFMDVPANTPMTEKGR